MNDGDISPEPGGVKVIATSTTGVIEEYLRTHPNLNQHIEGRLVYRNS
ncbi:MAG: hypothetical protein WC620_00090 [Methanoregula sp.]